MRICVVGWYFDPKFIQVLQRIQHIHSVYIVCHKQPDFYFDIPYYTIPNVGLEFGCYDWYLRTIWDGVSNVLFTHDDTKISGTLDVFKEIALLGLSYDCTYIFRDLSEEKANGGKHGRAIFCSAKFLRHLLLKDGFWYDKENLGYIGHGQPRPTRNNGKPMDYNTGIYTFHRMLGKVRDLKVGLNVVNRVYFPEYECARRGTWRHKEREIARYGKS